MKKKVIFSILYLFIFLKNKLFILYYAFLRCVYRGGNLIGNQFPTAAPNFKLIYLENCERFVLTVRHEKFRLVNVNNFKETFNLNAFS